MPTAARFTLRRLVGVDDHAFGVRVLLDRGVCAFDAYALNLQPKQFDKIHAYLRILAAQGHTGLGAKQVENCGGIYELKPAHHRLLLCRIATRWIVVAAFSKNGLRKKDQTARIDDARDLAAAFVAEQQTAPRRPR